MKELTIDLSKPTLISFVEVNLRSKNGALPKSNSNAGLDIITFLGGRMFQ